MPYSPKQVSFSSTFSPERFTEYANFINRIVSGNKNTIIYPTKSFLVFADNTSPVIRIGPGICIIKNVFIHVYEETELDVRRNEYYFQGDSIGFCPYEYYNSEYYMNKYYNLFLYYDGEISTEGSDVKFVIVKNPTSEFIDMVENNRGLWIASFIVDVDCRSGHFVSQDSINITYSSIISVDKSVFGFEKNYVFTREDNVIVRYPTIDQINGGAVFENIHKKIIWRDDYDNSTGV